MRFFYLLSTIFYLLPSALHAAGEVPLPNPLRGTADDIPTLFGKIISGWFLGFTGVAALIFFVWGGFELIISQGGEEQIKAGKNKMLWATVGLVAVLISYMFLNTFLHFVFKI